MRQRKKTKLRHHFSADFFNMGALEQKEPCFRSEQQDVDGLHLGPFDEEVSIVGRKDLAVVQFSESPVRPIDARFNDISYVLKILATSSSDRG